jgi:hypothetical protein
MHGRCQGRVAELAQRVTGFGAVGAERVTVGMLQDARVDWQEICRAFSSTGRIEPASSRHRAGIEPVGQKLDHPRAGAGKAR